ncbi:hypothetical protein BK133_29565 [Paenibacillus sp. FSL H8-0548]|nr:hypothetical protein BK133_29565 [Paenibacillus sp. FSL H8-0548]
MHLKPKSVHSNANVQDRQLDEAEKREVTVNVQDRQLGEAGKREVSANVQDSLRAEEAAYRARSECTTILLAGGSSVSSMYPIYAINTK